MCYNATEDKMGGINNHLNVPECKQGLRKKLVPSLVLLVVIIIWVGIFYFYQRYPARFEELRGYGYLGAFLLSLLFNATVILSLGAIGMVFTLGAVLPLPAVVGLAGGIGAAIGESTGYMAGYSGCRIAQKSQAYGRIEGWVRRWGAIAIFFFAMVPFAFDLVGIAAGILRFPYWKFLLLCWGGRTILYIVAALAGAWGWEAVLPWLDFGYQ